MTLTSSCYSVFCIQALIYNKCLIEGDFITETIVCSYEFTQPFTQTWFRLLFSRVDSQTDMPNYNYIFNSGPNTSSLWVCCSIKEFCKLLCSTDLSSYQEFQLNIDLKGLWTELFSPISVHCWKRLQMKATLKRLATG